MERARKEEKGEGGGERGRAERVGAEEKKARGRKGGEEGRRRGSRREAFEEFALSLVLFFWGFEETG